MSDDALRGLTDRLDLIIVLLKEAAHPPVRLVTDQDRHADFLLHAMRSVLAQHPSAGADWIVSQAATIANGLFDRHLARWSGG